MLKNRLVELAQSTGLVFSLTLITAIMANPAFVSAATSQADCPNGTVYEAPEIAGRAGMCLPTGTATVDQVFASMVANAPKGQSDCGNGEVFVQGAANPTKSTDLSRCQPKSSLPGADACQYVQGEGTLAGTFRCAIAEFFITLAAAFVSLLATLLDFASSAFSKSIEFTVANAGTSYQLVATAVEKAWTTFRDLANILIIGLFVFIAISIILGLQEYGQKKLIARVIIVATLINFSFLFTTIAINTSNFMAAAVLNGIPADGNMVTSAGVPDLGMMFQKYMGVGSAFDTRNTLMQQYNSESGRLVGVMTYAFFTAIFVLLAAVVFAYGALLLFSRYILLFIVILPISALAFAAYLAPSLEESTWGKWKHALMQQLFFAPVLMVFLFIAVSVAKAMQASNIIDAGAKTGLAGFATDPTNNGVWQFAFAYIVILGTLWAGIYVASQLAGAAANRLALGGAALGLNIPGKFVAAGGRWFVGGRAAVRSHEAKAGFDSRASTIATLDPDKDKAQIKRLRGEMLALNRQKGRSDYLAKSSFDMANLKPIQKLNAAAGLGGVFGKTDKSYDKSAHAQDDKAIKEAIQAAVSNKDAEKLARKEHGEDAEGYTNAERSHKQSEKLVQAAEAIRDSQKHNEGLITRMEDAQKKLLESTTRRTEIASNSKISEAERRTLIAAEDHKIATINGDLRDITSRMKEIDREHEGGIKTARDAARVTADAVSKEKRSINSRMSTIQRQSSANAQEIGRMTAGGPITQFWRRATGGDLDPGQSHHVVDAVRGRTEGKFMDKVKEKDRMTKAAAKDEHHAPAPASGGGDGHGTTPGHA